MSMKCNIDSAFDWLLEKHENLKDDILTTKFEIYESLKWEDAARELVEYMIEQDIEVDGNMRSYL